MSNASKPTPGPWFVESDGTSIAMGGQVVIVAPAPDHSPIASQRANASLIAAAPDLLESLSALLADIERRPECAQMALPLAKAYAAIAKAKGASTHRESA